MALDDASLEGTLLVLTCAECGDTFPTGEDSDITCPTCGGATAYPASEPLL